MPGEVDEDAIAISHATSKCAQFVANALRAGIAVLEDSQVRRWHAHLFRHLARVANVVNHTPQRRDPRILVSADTDDEPVTVSA